MNGKKTRDSIVAGLFYPEDKDELKNTVNALLEGAETPPRESFCIISPHAGFGYCGEVMAEAYAAVRRKSVKRVICLGPVHRETEDQVFLTESDYFHTPLGPIQVDTRGVDELTSRSTRIITREIPHLEEHCIETQLPFIKLLFPEAVLLPILMGKPTITNVEVLSKALQSFLKTDDMETLMVISANLSAPASGEVSHKSAETLIAAMEEGNWTDLISGEHRKIITSCGTGCIAVCLSMVSGKKRFTLLKRQHSGVDGGIPNSVVEYGSFILEKGITPGETE